jgi:hypothetical protein
MVILITGIILILRDNIYECLCCYNRCHDNGENLLLRNFGPYGIIYCCHGNDIKGDILCIRTFIMAYYVERMLCNPPLYNVALQ